MSIVAELVFSEVSRPLSLPPLRGSVEFDPDICDTANCVVWTHTLNASQWYLWR